MDQNHTDIDENLLLQYLLGKSDPVQETAVQAWLNAESGNRRVLDRLESLWVESGRLTPAPVAVDVNRAWKRVSSRMAHHEKSKFRIGELVIPVYRISSRNLVRAAAVIILLIGSYAIYRFTNLPLKKVELASETMIIHDTLPDGSKVYLNMYSTLLYPEHFKEACREVTLNGDAYFEIKPDEKQPFIVHAGKAVVRVLGTSFRVNTNPDGVADTDGSVKVTVYQGRVAFFNVGGEIADTTSLVMLAGESGILKRGALYPSMTEAPSPDDHFWANRSLDFRNISLSMVFALLEKYYPVKITTSDPAIAKCRLTASFVNEPADRIIAVIAASFGLQIEMQGQNVHLTGHGCDKNDQ